MDARKELLLASAARLYSLGVDLEAARERCSPQMRQPQDMAFITPATPAWRIICGYFVAGVIIGAQY